MSNIEERLARDISAVTGGVVVTESDLRDARDTVEFRIENRRQSDRRRSVVAAAVAAVLIPVLGVVAVQTLGGDDETAPPVNQPTNLTDEAFLSGSDPTAELIEGVWHFDTVMVSYTADGEARIDDGGRLFTDPAVIGTYTITGDLITVDVTGGRVGCAGEQLALRASLPAAGEMHFVPTQSGVDACTWVLNEQLTASRVLPASDSFLAGLEVSEEDVAAMQPPDGMSRLYGAWIAQDGQYLLELSAGGGYYVAAASGDVVDRGQWSVTDDRSQLRLVSQSASPTCDEGDRLVLGDLGHVRTADSSALRGTTQRNACGAPWTPELWILLPHRG